MAKRAYLTPNPARSFANFPPATAKATATNTRNFSPMESFSRHRRQNAARLDGTADAAGKVLTFETESRARYAADG